MALSPSPNVNVNPSANNPVVTLQTDTVGVARGDGLSGPFILELGATAFTYAAMTTVVTGSPASCTVQLQGTMDGVNWTTLATSTSTTGDVQFSTGANQFGALRAHVTAVSGGTSPTLTLGITAFAANPNPAAGGSQPVSPFIPAAANVLSGSATAANTVAAQTILTVPAGRTWYGSLAITMTNQAATGTLVSSNINTAGTNPVPLAAVNLLGTQAGSVGTVAGDATNSNQGGPLYVVAPAGNSITLTLTNSTATTCTSSAQANGVLL